MSKNRAFIKDGPKTGSSLRLKKTRPQTSSPNLASKVRKALASESFSSKRSTLGANIVTGVVYRGSDQQASTIIVEKTSVPEWQLTPVEKMNMVREGISKKKLESLKSQANLDYDKLATLLSTNRATLINKKGTEHFSAALSERIVSIADLYSYGFEVFEDEAKFNKWIFKPNPALGGKLPFELMDNQYGREEVKNVIGRIDYGVYS